MGSKLCCDKAQVVSNMDTDEFPCYAAIMYFHIRWVNVRCWIIVLESY